MTRFPTIVETYFEDLRRIRASGGATGERSTYPPLANLLTAVGAGLKPKVFGVVELAQQGAGHPDIGLYAARQVQCGQPREGQPMVAIAARLGLRSRQHLWAAYRRPAVEAVTREFLALAQGELRSK